MNIYDFDETIYDGDSTLDFWWYCLKHWPKAIIALPRALCMGVINALHLCGREKFKEAFFSFLRYIPNTNKAVSDFWDQNESRIKPWYLNSKAESNVIISASPEFLLQEICNRLKVRLIASNVNSETGKFESCNCKGEEKVRRFLAEYPTEKIESFFSDSQSDIYLARMATNAYLIHKNKIEKWELQNDVVINNN